MKIPPKKFGRIYKLTFSNGKVYIGATTLSVEKRFKVHAKNSKTRNSLLYRAWREFGPPELSRLGEFLVCDLDRAEAKAISREGCLAPKGLNELPGGKVSPMSNPEICKRANDKATETKRMPEVRAKYSESAKRVARERKDEAKCHPTVKSQD